MIVLVCRLRMVGVPVRRGTSWIPGELVSTLFIKYGRLACDAVLLVDGTDNSEETLLCPYSEQFSYRRQNASLQTLIRVS